MSELSQSLAKNAHDGKKDYILGLVWVFVSMLCGTAIFIIAKGLLVVQTQANCCYWWFGFALMFYLAYFTGSGKSLKGAVTKSNLPWYGLFALMEISGTILFFYGLSLIEPSTASFLQRSQVIFVLVLGVAMLGERFSLAEYLAGVMIIAGMVLITFQGAGLSLTGAVVTIIATCLQSVSVIIVRKIGSSNGSHVFALTRTGTLFTFYLIYAALVPGAWGFLPIRTMFVVMAGAFFGPFMLIFSSYKALEYMEAGKSALFRSAQPFFVMLASMLLFGVKPDLQGIIGGVIIVLGNIMFIRAGLKKKEI